MPPFHVPEEGGLRLQRAARGPLQSHPAYGTHRKPRFPEGQEGPLDPGAHRGSHSTRASLWLEELGLTPRPWALRFYREQPPADRVLISAWRLYSFPKAAMMSWSDGIPVSEDKNSSRLREAVKDGEAMGLQRVGHA